MSDKTITQLALESGVETGSTENALAILRFAKAYADQEKRKEAIAFNKFVREGFSLYPNGWGSIYHNMRHRHSDDELYDLFIQSLPSFKRT